MPVFYKPSSAAALRVHRKSTGAVRAVIFLSDGSTVDTRKCNLPSAMAHELPSTFATNLPWWDSEEADSLAELRGCTVLLEPAYAPRTQSDPGGTGAISWIFAESYLFLQEFAQVIRVAEGRSGVFSNGKPVAPTDVAAGPAAGGPAAGGLPPFDEQRAQQMEMRCTLSME